VQFNPRLVLSNYTDQTNKTKADTKTTEQINFETFQSIDSVSH